MNADGLEVLVIARTATKPNKPIKPGEIAGMLQRFAPTTLSPAGFRVAVDAAIVELQHREILDGELRLRDPDELARRIGRHAATRWSRIADLLLPAYALGIAADDTKSHARLTSSDGWAAAIAARALGLWSSGPPPTLSALCDALAWRELGLPGKPKTCPAEIRAHFVQRQLGTEAGTPKQQVRLLAARESEAPRPAPRALRDALVRGWLTGRPRGRAREPAPARSQPPTSSFAGDVREIARGAREGVFGDRKVFISTVWDALRRRPAWSVLTLDDFKARLVSAHRAGDLALGRADLVAAMDPALVASSETTTDGASFHFIIREPS
jgi:hypothetical protein